MTTLFDGLIKNALRQMAQRLEDELGRKSRELTADERGDFPYPVIDVHGPNVVAAWEMLGEDPNITPVIIGTVEEDLGALAWPFEPGTRETVDVPTTLAAADEIAFETGIFELRAEELRQMLERAREDGNQQMVDLLENGEDDTTWRDEIENAPWPDAREVYPQTGPISLENWQTGRREERLLIALIPTDDPTELPAFLSWGGWNSNPMPEWHVAACRSWQARFGAVPVVMRRDILEFKVANPPKTREAATALALEMYEYCPDIVDQGVGTIPALAATVLASNWWYFWWD